MEKFRTRMRIRGNIRLARETTYLWLYIYNLTGVDSTSPAPSRGKSMVTIDIARSKMGLTNERLEQ